MDTNLRLISNVIYSLKRQFGLKITIYRPSLDSTNLQTGNMVVSKTSVTINRAVIVPQKDYKSFIPYTRGGEFQYGAIIDLKTKFFLVDSKDMGSFTLDQTCYIEYNSEKYEISEFTSLEGNTGILIVAKHVGATE